MEGSAYVLVGNGGVGRTTTALHLGAALEREGHNTAVVDGDLNMTNMASLLDVDPDTSIHDVLDRNASVNDAVVHGPDDVTIVPGTSGSTAELDHDDKGPKLNRVVEPLRAAHDIILIDSPPELQPIHRDIMENVDGTILVTTSGESAIETAQDGAKAANLISCDALGVMLMQTTSMTDESDIVHRIGEPALASVPESKVLTEAPNFVDVGGTVQDAFEGASTQKAAGLTRLRSI
jgi:septum site-determining protein MinD